MSEHNFKVGDRVAAYEGDRGVGVISKIVSAKSDGTHFVEIEGMREGEGLWVHPKQLRKLKSKKERRRIWIEYKKATGGVWMVHDEPVETRDGYDVLEFIEVIKKAYPKG